MKNVGLTVSILGHIIVLGWGLFTLTAPAQFETIETVDIPFEVEIADDLSASIGDDKAPITEKPNKTEHIRDNANPNAANVGDGEKDTNQPLKPKEPDRNITPAQQNAGKPNADANIPVVTPPVKPETPPVTEQPQTPKVDTPPEPKVEPKVEPTTPPVAEPEATQNPEAPAETKVTEVTPKTEDTAPKLPTTAPLPMVKPVEVAENKTPPISRGEENVKTTSKDNSALVDNRQTRGGGNGASTGPASRGADKNIGDGALRNTVKNLVGGCIQRNANIGALAGRGYTDLYVELRFQIGRDNLVEGSPTMKARGGDEASRETFSNQVLMAVYQCESTFKQLPADKYDEWHDLMFNVKYGGM